MITGTDDSKSTESSVYTGTMQLLHHARGTFNFSIEAKRLLSELEVKENNVILTSKPSD